MTDTRTPEQVIADATARAAADVQRGIADLEQIAADTPDFVIWDDASGRRLCSPAGAQARGMLAHLRRSSGS